MTPGFDSGRFQLKGVSGRALFRVACAPQRRKRHMGNQVSHAQWDRPHRTHRDITRSAISAESKSSSPISKRCFQGP